MYQVFTDVKIEPSNVSSTICLDPHSPELKVWIIAELNSFEKHACDRRLDDNSVDFRKDILFLI